jgi:hypothetical protein
MSSESVATRRSTDINEVIRKINMDMAGLGIRIEETRFFCKEVLGEIQYAGLQSNDTVVGQAQQKNLLLIRRGLLDFIHLSGHGRSYTNVVNMTIRVIDNIDLLLRIKPWSVHEQTHGGVRWNS